MPNEIVHIGHLHLQVPGLTADQGRRMGWDVAKQIGASLLPHGRASRLGILNVRVTVPTGTTRDQLARIIAEGILLRLE